MVDIDATPGPAGNKSNEPEGRFDFYIAEFKEHAEPLIEDAAKWLAYKAPYDESRQVLENDTQVSRATELAKELGAFIGPKGSFVTLFKTDSAALDGALKTMKELRDKWLAPIIQFEGELRDRINVYQRKQRAAQLKKEDDDRAKATALTASGKPEDIQKAAEVLAAPTPRAGTVKSDHGSTAGYAIKFKVQSIMDDELPRELMSPDMKKINARIATLTDEQKKTPFAIPGVVLVEDIQTRLT